MVDAAAAVVMGATGDGLVPAPAQAANRLARTGPRRAASSPYLTVGTPWVRRPCPCICFDPRVARRPASSVQARATPCKSHVSGGPYGWPASSSPGGNRRRDAPGGYRPSWSVVVSRDGSDARAARRRTDRPGRSASGRCPSRMLLSTSERRLFTGGAGPSGRSPCQFADADFNARAGVESGKRRGAVSATSSAVKT